MVGVGKHRGMGIDKLGDGAKDIDFNKQVRKAKSQPPDEAIIDGVTRDSIAGFVEATNAAKHAARNPVTFGERVRGFFRRR